jgi:putative PIN family toxin of toxin-antitoxin system
VKVVIDTNVLVSGLLSPYNASAEVVRLTVAGALLPLYDARILDEYREVLLNRGFEIGADYAQAVIDAVEANGEAVIGLPLKERLPDPHDEAFAEIAISGDADFLVTFNLKHFPKRSLPIKVVEPKTFLEAWRRK